MTYAVLIDWADSLTTISRHYAFSISYNNLNGAQGATSIITSINILSILLILTAGCFD